MLQKGGSGGRRESVREGEGREGELMMRLLMLSIQIDRKDNIIRELLAACENGGRQEIEQLTSKCQNYEIQIKTLRETIAMLKESISVIQSNKNKDFMFNSMSQFNAELEERVHLLQTKLKKEQELKIQIENQFNNFKTNQAMSEFKLINAQRTEKAKVRDLQGELASERAKTESERRLVIEKANIIDELKNKIGQMQNNERYIVQQYQDRMRTIQKQVMMQDNLKRSQINSNQERLAASALELTRLGQDNLSLRQTIERLRETIAKQDKDLQEQISKYRIVENRFTQFETESTQTINSLERQISQAKVRERENSRQRETAAQKLITQVQECRFTLSNRSQEVRMYAEQASRLKVQVGELYGRLDQQKAQIRRLKRKPVNEVAMCQGCRAREVNSTSTILSQRAIGGVDMGQIIAQTQQLIRSNMRVQNLISKHESALQSSIQMYPHYD